MSEVEATSCPNCDDLRVLLRDIVIEGTEGSPRNLFDAIMRAKEHLAAEGKGGKADPS